MENTEPLLETAKKQLKVADHMLTVTYPLLREVRLLLSVAENLYKAMENALSALLARERQYKHIPSYRDDRDAKLTVFKMKIVPKFGFDTAELDTLTTLKHLIFEHKKSPIEFSRKGKFVICSDTYAVRTLSIDDLKKHMLLAKKFLNKVESVMAK